MATKTQLINGGFQDLEGNPLANGFLLMELNQDEQVSGTGQIVSKVVLKILLDSNGNVLGTPSPFTLSQVSVSGSVVTYTGTITGGGGNAYNGVSMVIAGFANGGNNGTFTVTGSTTTTLTVALTTQVNEVHAGTATGGTVLVWGTDVLTPSNAYYMVRGYKSTGQLVWGPNAQQVTSGATFDLNTWTPNQVITWNPPTTDITLQTNSINNTVQSKLNLIAGSNITLTSDSAGGVTVAASNTGVAGAISITKTENVGGVGSTSINLSNEGAVDWFTVTGSSYALPTTSTSHGKVTGGWLKLFFYSVGPLGTISNAFGSSTTPWLWTTTLGDDDTAGSVTFGNNRLNAVNNASGLRSNDAVDLISGGFGFKTQVPAKSTTRTLNLYIGFQSGSVATNNSLVISAKLADDSATPQTLTITPGDVNTHWYKVSITFNGSAGSVPLCVSVLASQLTADTNTFVYFGAATCF